MAVASDRVRATAIEANEFPDLSRAYRVVAGPKIVINDRVEFEGALPEAQFLAAVLEAAAKAEEHAPGRNPPVRLPNPDARIGAASIPRGRPPTCRQAERGGAMDQP